MKRPKCKTCGKEHTLGGCPEFKSTAARKDVHGGGDVIRSSERSVERLGIISKANPTTNLGIAGTQALPVDTLHKPKMGRPRTGYIKAEYNRQYMSDLRTIKRLGLSVTVAQYRKSKETLEE